MSVLLKKLLWFRKDNPTTAINLTDAIDMNVGRGIDIQNNIVNLNLKNSGQSFDVSGDILHKYIDTNGVIKFEENDQVKVYLKYTDDMADVEADAWDGDSLTEPSNTDLKGVYYVIDFNVLNNNKESPIKIKCADKTYILFNKLLVRTFTKAQGFTSPTALQKVVRYSSENEDGNFLGTDSEAGVNYDVDARLDSERTAQEIADGVQLIQDTRRATAEDGSATGDTSFPTIALAKVWKPVYEWVQEFSQIEYTNTTAELAGSPVYGRPFLNYVDELNRFHWFETDNVVGETIVIGTTTGIYNYKLDKKVFDIVNFIIFRGGEDFYGQGTLDFEVDDTSTIANLKMRVVAMVDIAKELIQAEIATDNLISATDGEFTFGGNRYDRDGTVTALWDNVEYSSDSDYNTALRTEILKRGKARARGLIAGLSDARYKGTMERKGKIYSVGQLLKLTNKNTGQSQELIRVMDVRDNITKAGWFSTLGIEQDQKAIIGVT